MLPAPRPLAQARADLAETERAQVEAFRAAVDAENRPVALHISSLLDETEARLAALDEEIARIKERQAKEFLAEARRLTDRARQMECDGSMFGNPLKVEAWRALNRRADALYDEIDAMGITDAQIRLWDEE